MKPELKTKTNKPKQDQKIDYYSLINKEGKNKKEKIDSLINKNQIDK